jgi:outer membrane protein assembly factor BamB
MTLRPRQLASHMLVAMACLGLAACGDLPTWMGGNPPEIKRAPGERIDVLLNPQSLQPDATAQDVAVEIPEQANLEQWRNINQAMVTAHIGLTGVTNSQSARVGAGHDFVRSVVSAPVVADGLVFAMDAAGIVSAHSESDIDTVKWVDKTGSQRGNDALGGGVSYAEGVLYASTGAGNLRALEAATGTVKWSIATGAPVRGAPAIDGGFVVVLTADNQTLAYDAATGEPRWSHRGIRETAGYFSTTAPAISDGIVVAAYSSGEVFALRLESGSVLWRDTLASGQRTKASAALSGIDANPIVQDGVVVVTSASGEMQASALLNGRPLWQQRIGTHVTPWSAGNVLFVLSDTHDIAAILKRDGAIRWTQSLAVKDKRDATKDRTPPLYGPILSGNAVLVLDGEGNLTSFNPTTGERIASYELASGIVTSPVVANGAMYVLTKSGTLYKYY